jgi:hypothetical protein
MTSMASGDNGRLGRHDSGDAAWVAVNSPEFAPGATRHDDRGS